MKPVRLPASATLTLPRWGLVALCLLCIIPGLVGRDLWKPDDAVGFGIMWTMAHGGLADWLWPHIVGLPHPEEGPLTFWIGALFIKLFGWAIGEMYAARLATFSFFVLASVSVWQATYRLGGRSEAQPLKLAFGGQPEAADYGRTLADGALLIYLGSLGQLLHSHTTSANALQVALVAASCYAAVRFFETLSGRSAALLGLILGLQVLTRGWVVPLALFVGLAALTAHRDKRVTWRIILNVLPVALLVGGSWIFACYLASPFNSTPVVAWMDWNFERIGPPFWPALQYMIKDSVWFAWPAWPFAAWAMYAWRRQGWPLHIALPATFVVVLVAVGTLDPNFDQGLLLPLLPALAILAAFGLPTMKRGAINGVDWFSVLTLTVVAVYVWLAYIAVLTGWPPTLAKTVMRQVPGYKAEFGVIAFAVAAAVTVGWFFLVHWRLSRRPSVLWRAVVLSSGGVILAWVLLMTLFLPPLNYSRSYAEVARQIAAKLPPVKQCVDSDVGPVQRASFAYFGHVPFAQFDGARCDFLLLQDAKPKTPGAAIVMRDGSQWRLVWEGRRQSDRSERFRLYQRE